MPNNKKLSIEANDPARFFGWRPLALARRNDNFASFSVNRLPVQTLAFRGAVVGRSASCARIKLGGVAATFIPSMAKALSAP